MKENIRTEPQSSCLSINLNLITYVNISLYEALKFGYLFKMPFFFAVLCFEAINLIRPTVYVDEKDICVLTSGLEPKKPIIPKKDFKEGKLIINADKSFF